MARNKAHTFVAACCRGRKTAQPQTSTILRSALLMLKSRTGQSFSPMRSHRAGVRTSESKVRLAGQSFRSEMERQLLEIQDAFNIFVDDFQRQKLDAEGRLREMERQRMDTEDRLRTVERQKEDLEHHLLEAALKLQKTPVVRFVRFLIRLNPLRSSRE